MSQVTGALAAHALRMYTAPAMGILSRDAEYLANAAAGNMGVSALPSAEELTRLYHSGFFAGANGRTNFNAFMLQHGIDMASVRRPSAAGRERQAMWNGILNLRKPEYSVDFLRKLWRQSVQAGDAAADSRREYIRIALGKLGFRDRDQQDWFIDEDTELPLPVLQLLLRLGMLESEQDFRARAKVLGVPDGEAAWYAKLRYTLPTPQMIMAAIETHAWDREFISSWGMDSPTSDKWITWMRRLGYDYSAGTRAFGDPIIDNAAAGGGGENSASGTDITWAEVIWRTNLRMPTLGELAQFRHRFRGDPNDQSTWSDPQVKPITWRDMQKFMDANHVPTLMRQMYERLFYSVPNKREIHSFIATGSTNVGEVAGWLMDNGMRPDIAQRQSLIMFAEQQQRNLAPIFKQRMQALASLRGSIEKAYETGTLTNAAALVELVANGMDQAAAVTTLAAIDIHVANKLSDEVIKRMRSEVFSGVIAIGTVGPRLIQAGIAAPRVAQLVAIWTAQLHRGRKTLGTEKTLRYLRQGFITRDQALVRLTNLGWSGQDLLLLLHEVQAQLAADTAKVIAAGERDKAQEEHAIERQLHKTAGLANSLMGRLKTLTPPAKLLQWYKRGLWSEDKVRKRLRLLGYTDDVIDTMLLEALSHPKPATAKKDGVK